MENRTEMEMEQRMPLTRVQADPGVGLSAEQVKERFACHADNYKVESSTMSVSDIVKSNVFTYFNLVFAIIAVLLSIVGAWRDMLFLPIIVANTCIGIIQEVHSKKVLDKLSILNAPQSVVIREGKKGQIAADKLVLDDVVELTPALISRESFSFIFTERPMVENNFLVPSVASARILLMVYTPRAIRSI